jgi:putative PIN family toxin of toxin-antitoxin system
MKVFFDTNVYVAEALLGRAAERMINATIAARWRIFTSQHLIDEVERVMARMGFSRRLAELSAARIKRRSKMIVPPLSRHTVQSDPQDSPILRAAIAGGVDILVTNDRHLLVLDPYEGIRIVPMDQYLRTLEDQGMLK